MQTERTDAGGYLENAKKPPVVAADIKNAAQLKGDGWGRHKLRLTCTLALSMEDHMMWRDRKCNLNDPLHLMTKPPPTARYANLDKHVEATDHFSPIWGTATPPAEADQEAAMPLGEGDDDDSQPPGTAPFSIPVEGETWVGRTRV